MKKSPKFLVEPLNQARYNEFDSINSLLSYIKNLSQFITASNLIAGWIELGLITIYIGITIFSLQ